MNFSLVYINGISKSNAADGNPFTKTKHSRKSRVWRSQGKKRDVSEEDEKGERQTVKARKKTVTLHCKLSRIFEILRIV